MINFSCYCNNSEGILLAPVAKRGKCENNEHNKIRSSEYNDRAFVWFKWNLLHNSCIAMKMFKVCQEISNRGSECRNFIILYEKFFSINSNENIWLNLSVIYGRIELKT